MSTPNTLEDDFDRGLKNRRAVLGDAWALTRTNIRR